jgi:alpha/beta superfamily hydrolase
MTSYPQGNLLIPAPHGHLEAIYRPKSGRAERVALVLHPHPQFEGTMHNKVVFRAARALEAAGFETLRFNFRGVGRSTGAYDEGRGEAEDARVALDYLLASQPAAREVVVAGFSFGAAVGLRVGCAEARVGRLIAIGTTTRFGLEFLAGCAKPALFVHGEQDEIAPLAPLEAFLHGLPDASHYYLARVPGAGHFFEGKLDLLAEEIAGFLAAGAAGV